ncbi:PREDICTED: uncharacterized protein LOC104727468 [Camelina sativa]|uniref:Uncharacterized protein LOC104727468 n=1 Tax=Camelina sativa TaxID=90675 RepID=A0ABM1QMM4_CAMSA|nr:PREDICTED: uncharacterized protein LOC104727468 [Camelina sativa]
MRILDVSSYGVIQAKRPGIATVKAVSTCDPHNFDEIVVKVFPSQDVCYDMDDMDHKLDNDLSEPIYVSKRKPIWKTCLKMTDLVIFLVGGIFAVVCSYCFSRDGSVMPINRCSKKQFKGSSMRRIRRYRR